MDRVLKAFLIFALEVCLAAPLFAQRPAESGFAASGKDATSTDPTGKTCASAERWSVVSQEFPDIRKSDEPPDSTSTQCPWGEVYEGVQMLPRGSGTDAENFLTAARKFNLAELGVPSGEVCHIVFEAKPIGEKFKYDDYIFFNVNGLVLAAGQYYEHELKDENYLNFPSDQITGLLKFNLAGLIGSRDYRYYQGTDGQIERNDISNAYCAPGASCKIPKSDTPGYLLISYSVARGDMFEAIKSAGVITVDQWITGNEKRGINGGRPDCTHSGLTGKVSVYYVPDR